MKSPTLENIIGPDLTFSGTTWQLPPKGTIFDFASLTITGLGVPVYFSRWTLIDHPVKFQNKFNFCWLKIAGSGGDTSTSSKSGDYILRPIFSLYIATTAK